MFFAPITREYFRQPDQQSVRADLAVFFGRGAEACLRHYEKRCKQVLEGRFYMPGWSWSVCLGWWPWFWFRKLWVHGVLAFLVPVAGGYVAGDAGFILCYALMCMVAKNSYLHTALRAVAQADIAGLTGEPRRRFLTARGGVSWAGGIAATILLLAVCVGWTMWRLDDIIAQLYAMGLVPDQ